MTILVTNDDSFKCAGVHSLISAALRIDDVIAVVPDRPRSGASKAMTFDKVLRAEKSTLRTNGKSVPTLKIRGTPADCVMFGLEHFTDRNISLVLSGINPGDNTSYHSILSSGTLGACFEAALLGVPGISFSHQTDAKNWFDHNPFQPEDCVEDWVERIVGKTLEEGLPPLTDILSVNFPTNVTPDTPVEVRCPQYLRLTGELVWKKDPLGNDYFWLGSAKGCEFEKERDCRELLIEKNIVLTPLTLRMCVREDMEELGEWFG